MRIRFPAIGVCLLLPVARAADKPVDFAHEVVPILKNHCAECHLGDKRKGGFSMNTRALLLEGSENGEVVAAGSAAESHLIDVVTTQDEDARMPPKGKRLTAAEVEVLRRWIDGGLPWEEGFAFAEPAWEPPLKPRIVELPAAVDGRTNPIDRILDAFLAGRELERPGRADDVTFLRRLRLDVVGLLPEKAERDAFLTDGSPQKRARLIDAVLSNDVAYAEHWLTFWNDLLRNDYAGTGYIDGGRKQITQWLHRSLIENKPFDEFTRELIAPAPESAGFIEGIQWRGNVNASQAREVQFAQNISQVFLGINMKCASCHDSFIDGWKLEQAYNLAAVFANEPMEIHRCDVPTGATARAAWIFPELGEIDGAAPQPERLKQLAGLMTHPQNGRFTRTIVNRIWHRLMGRGIVHPVDAMHTEPWSGDLLDYLAGHFSQNGYDLKETIRLIVSSEAYQSRAEIIDEEPEPGDYVYRGPLVKRMTAEQFVDAVWHLTGAGPARADAQVLRAKAAPGTHGNLPLSGQWVWGDTPAPPAAGERVTLRKVFELARKPIRADGVITCDNGYALFVNGRKLGENEDWTTVETIAMEEVLKAGRNEILIAASNAGDKPNAAGAFFEARIRLGDGGDAETLTVSTDAGWEWTPRSPDAKGKWPKDEVPGDWKPVRVVGGGWMTTVGDQVRASLAMSASARPPLVRASLVKSDLLLRSLGRPNREQIVTVRPEQLTTLQAIDLANGDILSKTFAQGAANAMAGPVRDVDALISDFYLRALSREPTGEELAVMQELAGATASQQGIEDVLWAICMLPEFQLVR